MSTSITNKIIIEDEGTLVSSNNIINFEGAGVTVTNTGNETLITIPGSIPTASYGLYAQTSSSIPASGILRKSIIGPGVGTLTVPANFFQIGDSFTCALDGIISSTSSSKIHIHVETLGGVVLADTGLVNMTAATNRPWLLNLYFTVRKLGIATLASISSGGFFSYIKNGGVNFEGFVLSTINSTTFDTTIDNTLTITVQWDTDSTSNSIQSLNFVLTKVY